MKQKDRRKAMFNYVKVDTSDEIIHGFIGEKKKSYQIYKNNSVSSVNIDEITRKIVKKGCPKKSMKQLKDKDILGLIKSPNIMKANFNKLQSKTHKISMINQTKRVSSSFDNSAFYKSCGICNVPFFCDIKDVSTCKSVECKKSKLLIDIWSKVV
jgi:hypothetical protein